MAGELAAAEERPDHGRTVAGRGCPKRSQTSDERLTAAQQALQRMTSGRGDPQYAAAVAAVEEASRELGRPPAKKRRKTRRSRPASSRPRTSSTSASTWPRGQAKNGQQERSRDRQAGEGREPARSRPAPAGGQQPGRLRTGSRELSQGRRRALSRPAEADRQRRAPGRAAWAKSAPAPRNWPAASAPGAQKSTRLSSALGRIGSGVQRLQGPGGEGQFHQLDVQSPGLFRSGYFYLAGPGRQQARTAPPVRAS